MVGIDPGGTIGLCVVSENEIIEAHNLTYDLFWVKVTNYLLIPNVKFVIEDIRPYSLRLTPEVISTTKFIGEAYYRLKTALSCDCELVSRFEVKKWVFDTFPEVVVPLIEEKTRKANMKGKMMSKDGTPRKPSFISVDDKIVIKAMKSYWEIPEAKRGYGYQYGLKDHSWQALGLATMLLNFKRG